MEEGWYPTASQELYQGNKGKATLQNVDTMAFYDFDDITAIPANEGQHLITKNLFQ